MCTSCNAKRAQVTAVHLVERVLPHVPYRQWTLSFGHRVRWVLLKEAGLLSDVLTVFLRAVFALQRSYDSSDPLPETWLPETVTGVSSPSILLEPGQPAESHAEGVARVVHRGPGHRIVDDRVAGVQGEGLREHPVPL